MEIINDNRKNKAVACQTAEGRNIFLGAILLAIGIIWLLSNFDLIPHRLFDILISWQSLLIVIGGYLMSTRYMVSGAIIGGIGLFFLMFSIFDVHISFDKVILPTILIAAGAGIILSRVAPKDKW